MKQRGTRRIRRLDIQRVGFRVSCLAVLNRSNGGGPGMLSLQALRLHSALSEQSKPQSIPAGKHEPP